MVTDTARPDAAIVHRGRPVQPLAGEDPPVQLDQAAAHRAAQQLDLALALGLQIDRTCPLSVLCVPQALQRRLSRRHRFMSEPEIEIAHGRHAGSGIDAGVRGTPLNNTGMMPTAPDQHCPWLPPARVCAASSLPAAS